MRFASHRVFHSIRTHAHIVVIVRSRACLHMSVPHIPCECASPSVRYQWWNSRNANLERFYQVGNFPETFRLVRILCTSFASRRTAPGFRLWNPLVVGKHSICCGTMRRNKHKLLVSTTSERCDQQFMCCGCLRRRMTNATRKYRCFDNNKKSSLNCSNHTRFVTIK